MDGGLSDSELSPVAASNPAEGTDNRFQRAIAAWKGNKQLFDSHMNTNAKVN